MAFRPASTMRRLLGSRAPVRIRNAESSWTWARKTSTVSQAKSGPEGSVDLTFSDGASYRFHSLWLRDACRDERFVSGSAQERILGKTLLMAGCPEDLDAKALQTTPEGNLHVQFNDGTAGDFEAHLLRSYAQTVGKALNDDGYVPPVDTEWLKPYTGLPDTLAPSPSQVNYWGDGSLPPLKDLSFQEAMEPTGNLELLQTLLRDGIVRITDVESPGPVALHKFCDACFNGLQKDPSRDEANWLIAPKKGAVSISYAPTLKLNNHTDQSLPNHGIPAIFLVMHTVQGYGVNTFCDSYAVGEALRKRDPEGFDLLSKYGNSQVRLTSASRQDAKQGHTVNLRLTSGQPIFQLDKNGGIVRSQYNEVFRVPSELPFDVFKKWYAAYLKFGKMIHDPEFERRVSVKAGQIVIINNWRVLHGRDGNWDGTESEIQSRDRILTGGTVTRENCVSKARDLLQQIYGTELYGTQFLA